MTEMLPAEPANRNKRKHECQDNEEYSSGALANSSLQKNEAHNERQHAIDHVPQQQAPMK